jgi:DNA-directed RNA polymerase specialized sigma24 family protein
VRSAVKYETDLTGNVMADQDPPPDAVNDPWAIFGDDAQSAGERFEVLRRKLVFYFEARHCDDPEELAHETLGRLMQKHGENVEVIDLMRYSYGIAKNVLHEYLRQKKAEQKYVRDQGRPSPAGIEGEGAVAYKERRLKCLEECAARLNEQESALLADYFKGRGRSKQEHRRRMAEQLNITRETLTLRVFYLKRKLRKCIEKCLEES